MFVLFAQQFGQLFRQRTIVDGVEAHVSTEQFELALVIIAQRADMVLLYPAATRVFRTEEYQHRRFELRHFVHA